MIRHRLDFAHCPLWTAEEVVHLLWDLPVFFPANDGDSARDVYMATMGARFPDTWPTAAAPRSTKAKGRPNRATQQRRGIEPARVGALEEHLRQVEAGWVEARRVEAARVEAERAEAARRLVFAHHRFVKAGGMWCSATSTSRLGGTGLNVCPEHRGCRKLRPRRKYRPTPFFHHSTYKFPIRILLVLIPAVYYSFGLGNLGCGRYGDSHTEQQGC